MSAISRADSAFVPRLHQVRHGFSRDFKDKRSGLPGPIFGRTRTFFLFQREARDFEDIWSGYRGHGGRDIADAKS
jgi:hypothetical protein